MVERKKALHSGINVDHLELILQSTSTGEPHDFVAEVEALRWWKNLQGLSEETRAIQEHDDIKGERERERTFEGLI